MNIKKLCCIIIALSLLSNLITYADDELSTNAVIENVVTDGSEASASWFYVFESLLKDKALNGLKFYKILDSLRKPEFEVQVEEILNSNFDRKVSLANYGLNNITINKFLAYYMSTFPESLATAICYGNNCGQNIYADIYFEEDIEYSKYMDRFHLYLNDLFSQLPQEMQIPIRKYDRLGAGEIIVMQRLMNILIRDYIAFEVYDTSNGEIISRDLRLRDEIRNLLITELTTIANTYSEEYLNDPTKDKSVDAKEIEDYVNVFMEFGNVILESFEYNFESSDLMDEVIDLSEETNLLIRTGVTPTIEVTTVINPISLILNTDFIELDSSTPLTNGYINEFQLIPTVTGTNRPVIYSTVDPDIISVSSNGHITLSGVKDGLATIYATIEGYDVYKEVRVQVSEETPASSIKFYGPYISGYPDNSFKANNIITRAEIATMFSRVLMLDINEDGSSKYDEKSFEIPSYSDVDKDDWSYIYVEIARKEGLMSGYADGTFKPDGSMSRAEIAVIISNAWELLGVKSSKLANHYILDVDSQHWAFDAINKVYNAKIVSGYDDGTFRPDNYTTRAEIVIMINSILNRRDYKPIEESFNDILRSHWAYGAIESAIRIQEVKYDIGDN